MRVITAACLHEGFLLTSPMEDIKKLQISLLELLDEENKEIMLALIPNIRTLIERFCNEHAMSQLPDTNPTGDNTPTKAYGLSHSNTAGNKLLGTDFSSLHRKYDINANKGFGGGFKKLPTMHIVGAVTE